jgi:hypothetical protein
MLLPSSCSSSLSPLARWRKRPRLRRRRRKNRLRSGCSIGDGLLELKTGESQVTALRSSPTSHRASRSRFRDDHLLGDGCHGSFGRQTNFGGKFHENVWDSGGDWGDEHQSLLLQVGHAVGLGTSRARPSSSAQAHSCSSSPPTPCSASPPTIASRFTLSRSASPTLRTPSARAFAVPWGPTPRPRRSTRNSPHPRGARSSREPSRAPPLAEIRRCLRRALCPFHRHVGPPCQPQAVMRRLRGNIVIFRKN